MSLPKPYYEDVKSGIVIYHADCREILPQLPRVDLVLTDPPYNVGYHYDGYNDNLEHEDYASLLRDSVGKNSVILHYPEDMFFVSHSIGLFPTKCVAWVYNAHTRRKWRMISWFGLKPDFSLLKQPYKNTGDKRIREKIQNGSEGCDLYDWWQDEQVKNVSSEKTDHPCQIPTDIVRKIISISPGELLVDPFMGSGTTLRAAKDLGRRAIGIEIEEKYCEIAARRLQQEVLNLT